MKHFALIGAPGVGKGTFASIICKKMKLQHISVGDLVRNEIQQNTILGQNFVQYTNSGKLIPDELICNFIINKIHTYPKSILLDGFPR